MRPLDNPPLIISSSPWIPVGALGSCDLDFLFFNLDAGFGLIMKNTMDIYCLRDWLYKKPEPCCLMFKIVKKPEPDFMLHKMEP